MSNKNTENTPQGAPVKKKSFFARILTLVLVVCVVLAVVVLTTMEDGSHFASLRRWLMYGETGGAKDIYAYAVDPENRYGKLGTSLSTPAVIMAATTASTTPLKLMIPAIVSNTASPAIPRACA